MEKVTLKYGEDKRLLAGHQWILFNEIEKISGKPAIGETVQLTNKPRRVPWRWFL